MPSNGSPFCPVVRTLLFAATFMAFTLYWLPQQFIRDAHARLDWARLDAVQYAGLTIMIVGLVIGGTCIFDFAVVGRGTPAPFDPPRFLVKNLLYRHVRNPMYIGAILIGGSQATDASE